MSLLKLSFGPVIIIAQPKLFPHALKCISNAQYSISSNNHWKNKLFQASVVAENQKHIRDNVRKIILL
jgi:hypothetical protein